MHTEFETYLRTQSNLPPDAIQRISSLAVKRTLRRNDHIFTAGGISRHKIFVVQGMLRTYSAGADGSEHILQFAPEHSWTLDVESYDKEVPSVVNIGAVEPSEVLCWNKADFNTLLAGIPQFRSLADQIIARNIYYNRQRMLTMLSATPEERYEDFVRDFPGYLSRLPLRMIAAYLGMSIKTLTRIRHAQLQRS
jgi:CRP/FNR family transcriptional regulator